MAFHGGSQHPFLIHYVFCGESQDEQRRIIFKLAINGHLPLGNKNIEGGADINHKFLFVSWVFGEICFCYFFCEKEVLCFLPTSVREWRQQSKDLLFLLLPTTSARNSHRLLFRCITHPPDLSLELLQTCNFGFSRLREFVFLGMHLGSLKCQRMRKNHK